MIRALVRIRFRGMLSGFVAQSGSKKKPGVGKILLIAVLFLYLLGVLAFAVGFTFYNLAQPYHALGLDWLYFAMAGLMGLGFSVLGSVFTTQNQIYDAKDNDMLLAMPIPTWAILLSRILPLLALNLLFSGIVMIPAVVVYAVVIGTTVGQLLLQGIAWLAVTLLAQAIACMLGWLLHLLLSKMNKSLASMLYMVVFLAVYFTVYSQAGKILNQMAENGGAIAAALQTWAWPLYAMGQGSIGGTGHMLAFLLICCAVFAIVYWILGITFLRSAMMQHTARKRRKLALGKEQTKSPKGALLGKEWRKFIGTPVYLTNMGLGVILTAVLPVLGWIFSWQIQNFVDLLELSSADVALIVCAMITFCASTMPVSVPSVSLEGQNIWILKSMPVQTREILQSKLRLHCWLCVPVSAVAAVVLTAVCGCGIVDVVIAGVIAALIALLTGLLGMVCGLKWAKLDYINEAYPCKQSVAVLITMFGIMGIPLVLGLVYMLLLCEFLSAQVFLALLALVLAAVNFGLYRLMMGWGVRKWEML